MAGGNYDRSQKKSQLNPAVSYAFALQVEALFFLPLRSVRVFTKENEFDYYQEGGLNDYVHMLRKPISKPFTFQVERYVGVDAGFLDMNSGFIDPLALGTDLVLPLVLYVNRSPSGKWYQNIIEPQNVARTYVFTGCTVTAKEYGELNAEQSKLLTETTTIAYRELFTMNQIDPSWEKGDVWQINGADYKGNGESHDSNRTKGNATKSERMAEAAADRWQGDMDKYTGENAGMAYKGNEKYHTDERSRKGKSKSSLETEGKANQWIIDSAHPTGGGKDHTLNRAKGNPDKGAGERAGIHNKWGFPGSEDGNTSTDHMTNRSKNDPKSKGESSGKDNQWIIDEGHPTGGGKDHMENRAKGNPDKAAGERAGIHNKWGFPDSEDGNTSTDHVANRSKNDTKAQGEAKGKANLWPPARRALKAQALSKL